METEISYRRAALFLAQADPPSTSQWPLTGERMAIGRDPASDVHLDDSRISWHHADLVRHGASWSIADARSTNGTFVNGARVHEAVLQPQDRIRLGEIEFIVKDADPAGRRGPATALITSPGQRGQPGSHGSPGDGQPGSHGSPADGQPGSPGQRGYPGYQGGHAAQHGGRAAQQGGPAPHQDGPAYQRGPAYPGDRAGQGDRAQADTGPQGGPATYNPQGGPATYNVGWQEGINNNVAGNQANYYHESNLRYIASKRGRARALIVWGIVLFFLGNGLAGFAVYQYDQKIFDLIASSSASSGPPDIPTLFFPLIGVGALLSLLGLAMFIFGLIARSGAKKEARRLGAYRQ